LNNKYLVAQRNKIKIQNMQTYLEIIPIKDGEEIQHKFTSSISCNQLAMMLVDWNNHHYSDYSDKISQEDVNILKSSYGKESVSVLERDASFHPNIVSVYKLSAALGRLRNQMLYPVLKDCINKGQIDMLGILEKDLFVISECIGALEYIKHEFKEVYLAIEDC